MVVGGVSVYNHDSLGLLIKNGSAHAGKAIQVAGWQISGPCSNGPVGAGLKGDSSLPIVLDEIETDLGRIKTCLLYTSPSPRDRTRSRMPSSA